MLRFTLWAEPDDGDDISPAEVGGALTMRLSNDLLDFPKNSHRTRTLVVTSEAGSGAVNLKGGNITGAASLRCVSQTSGC